MVPDPPWKPSACTEPVLHTKHSARRSRYNRIDKIPAFKELPWGGQAGGQTPGMTVLDRRRDRYRPAMVLPVPMGVISSR